MTRMGKWLMRSGILIPDELLTDVAVDLDYMMNRWMHGSIIEKLIALIKTVKRADSFRFCLTNKPHPKLDDMTKACEQIGIEPFIAPGYTAADMCASVLMEGGFVVSGNMRLFPFLKFDGTIYRPLFNRWEVYRYSDWDHQYAVNEKHWDRFVDLLDGGMNPHRARKTCKAGEPECVINPVQIPSMRLSAETMSLILDFEHITKDGFE